MKLAEAWSADQKYPRADEISRVCLPSRGQASESVLLTFRFSGAAEAMPAQDLPPLGSALQEICTFSHKENRSAKDTAKAYAATLSIMVHLHAEQG